MGRRREMLVWQAALLSELGATCVDADAVASAGRVRVLNGWELKSFAVLHSRFEQVLYADADSYPCRDPSFLFDDPSVQQHGALFFPDAYWMTLLPEVWEILGIPFRDERTFESGQLLVDRRRCWSPLLLTDWMNQRSDYYYFVGPRTSAQVGNHFGRGVHGDKDTWHLAWRYLSFDYAMPERDYTWIAPAIVQHAPGDGQPVFVHRARRKFTLADESAPAAAALDPRLVALGRTNAAGFMTSPQQGPSFEPRLPMEREAHAILAELKRRLPDPRDTQQFEPYRFS